MGKTCFCVFLKSHLHPLSVAANPRLQRFYFILQLRHCAWPEDKSWQTMTNDEEWLQHYYWLQYIVDVVDDSVVTSFSFQVHLLRLLLLYLLSLLQPLHPMCEYVLKLFVFLFVFGVAAPATSPVVNTFWYCLYLYLLSQLQPLHPVWRRFWKSG